MFSLESLVLYMLLQYYHVTLVLKNFTTIEYQEMAFMHWNYRGRSRPQVPRAA